MGQEKDTSTESPVKLSKEHEEKDNGVPFDRGWAWMTVLGCFGMHILVVGGCKSLGVLIVEINDRFEGVSAKELFLVQGINMTLMMGLGIMANILAVCFSTRSVVFVGGLLSSAGFILTAFIDRFWLIYLTYSVICGVGFALSYAPCIVFVGSHFKKRKSLANGLALAGSGVGTFILPNFIRWSLKVYGLFGCCLLLGALMLNVCVCALLFRPHSSYKHHSMGEDRPYLDESLDVDEEEMMQINQPSDNSTPSYANGRNNTNVNNLNLKTLTHRNGNSFTKVDGLDRELNTPMLLLSENSKHQDHKLSAMELSTHDMTTLTASTLDLEKKSTLKSSPKKPIFEWSLLSNPIFLLYWIFAFLVNFGYPNIFFMLPAHSETNGNDRDAGAFLVSILGISDLIGRLFVGWFSDLRLFDRRYQFVGCVMGSGVLSLLLPLLTSYAGMMTYSSLYGFCAGGYMTLLAVILSDALGPEKLSSSFGLVMLSLSIALIPGPTICGQIRDMTGSWNTAFMFVGAMAVTASLFPLFQPCAARLVKKKESSRTENKPF